MNETMRAMEATRNGVNMIEIPKPMPGPGEARVKVIASAVNAGEESISSALDKVRSGRSLNVIGQAVQQVADREGYQIVKNLGSHGVGASIHEPSCALTCRPPGTGSLRRMVIMPTSVCSPARSWSGSTSPAIGG